MRALRYSLRTLARNPAFSAVIVLLLAFGIGANTLIFTAVDVLLLRDLPVDHPEQLVRLEDIHPNGFRSIEPTFPLAFQHLLTERAKSLSDVFFAGNDEMFLELSGRVESVTVLEVSGNFYRSLGVRPALGRFLDDKDRSAVVLSYSFWQRAFGGRANILNQQVRLRGIPFTVVGIAPRGFHHLALESGPDVIIPIVATLPSASSEYIANAQLFARLRPGLPVAQASAEIETLYPGLLDTAYNAIQSSTTLTKEQQEQNFRSDKRNRAVLEPVSRGISRLRKQFAIAVQVLLGAVGVLLLLVCANIAGLMLARGEAARKDIAIRLSLGATRFAVASQRVADALVLSILGTAGALIFTRWGGPLLLVYLPARRPQTLELMPDARVLAFAAAFCIVTTLAMSILPALHLFRADLSGLMGRAGIRQRHSRAGVALVALQVALSAMLLAGGAALVRTLDHLRSADLGEDRHNLIVMTVNARYSGARMAPAEDMIDQIVRRARALDGIDGVSVTGYPQMRGIGTKMTVAPTGTPIRDADFLNTTFSAVTVGHFENAGIHILAGRDFEPSDVGVKPVRVIVSQAFARRFFPNVDPVGKTFGSGMNVTADAGQLIIGVVNDIRFRSMREEAPPIFYQARERFDGCALYIRTHRLASAVISEMRSVIASAGIAPSEAATMEQDIETSLWQERLIAALASVFALASAILVAIGLYGLLAYSIARRTREIGIRMALGARPANIVTLVTRDVILSVAPGLILGLCAYATCSRILAPVLYGVRPMDTISLMVAIALILLVASAAGFLPTRRAIAIEPSEALRQE